MPKKEWSDEDRQAFGAKMKAAREAKQQEKEAKKEVAEAQTPEVDTAEVVRQVLAEILKGGHKDNTDRTVQTYSIDPEDYPLEETVEQLYDLSELSRFAPRENFSFQMRMEIAQYDKKDGKWYREPRFIFEVWRRPTATELAEAEEKGNKALTPTTEIFVGQHIQSEDDVAAKQAAQKLGLRAGVDYEDFDDLMNRMRTERIKQWLLSLPIFGGNAPKPKPIVETDMAISGQVVKVHNPGSKDEIVESEKIIRA